MSRDVRVDVTSGPVGYAVVRRVAGALGAQADLSLDRLHDVELVLDAVMAEHEGERVRIGFAAGDGGLELRLGPVPEGIGSLILTRNVDPDLGPIVERLADRVWVDRAGESEYLCLSVASRSA